MVSRLTEKLKKRITREQNNQGAAIIIVIVAVAFIGMLVAMLTYAAYYNTLMKHVDRTAKDNFYTASYALEVINAGLQKDVSDCMAEAYVKAVKTSVNQDSDAINLSFQNSFKAGLVSKLQSTPATTPATYSITHLSDMWTNAGITLAASSGAEGAWLEANGGVNSLSVTNTDYMTLHNLHIVYTDSKGYVSIIDTDIRIRIPSMDFAQNASNLNVEDFSLIANNELINDFSDSTAVPSFEGVTGLTKGVANTQISGSVYGGKKGVTVGNAAGIKFIQDPTDISAGRNLNYKLISDSLNINNTEKGIELDSSYSTYVENINVNSSRFVGNGSMYVGDDLDIAGKQSNITLSGIYRGYGNRSTEAGGSSSILINGVGTTLNFASLNELTLGGHAYVGAKRYDADKDRLTIASILDPEKLSEESTTSISNQLSAAAASDSDKITDQDAYDKIVKSDQYKDWAAAQTLIDSNYSAVPLNESDVLTGESISVKANQIFYMVPSECIGYVKGSSVQKYARNPMTYAEYKQLCTDFDYDKFKSKNESGAYVYPKYQELLTAYKSTPGNSAATDVPQEEIKPEDVPEDCRLYDVARLGVLWDKMGSPAFTSKYKAVYRRVNGTVMVYLYLDFDSNDMLANEFYKAYYQYDEESVNMYVNSYIDSLTWNNSLSSTGAALTLAGNAFRINGGRVVMLEDSLSDSNKYKNLMDYEAQYTDQYEALMHILKDDASEMTGVEADQDVFDNLINMDALNNKILGGGSATGKTFASTASDYYAYVGKANVVYPSVSCPAETAVIITTGDVYVKANYDGLIIAGGNIYVCNGCNKITYNPEQVLKALRLSFTGVTSTVYVYDVFGDKGTLSYGLGAASTGTGDSIAVKDLISYENWKKE